MNSNNKPKQEQPKPQQPVKQQQIPKQNNPVLKQTQPKMTQPKTPAFKPDKKIEKYANSNQFRADHAHDFDDDYEQEFNMSMPEKKLMSNKGIRDAVVDSNVKGNNTGIKNLLDNSNFDETDYKDSLDLLNDGKSNEDESINAHEYVPKGNEKLYLFPNDPAMGDFRNDVKKYGLEYAGRNKFNDEDNLVVRGSEDNLRKYADSLGYELHPDYLYNEREFAGDIYDDFDEVSDEELLNDDELWKDDNSPYVDFDDERWQQAADDMLSDISWKYQTRNRDKEETIDIAGSDLMREYGLNYEDAMRLATEAFYRRYGGK